MKILTACPADANQHALRTARPLRGSSKPPASDDLVDDAGTAAPSMSMDELHEIDPNRSSVLPLSLI